MAGASNMQLIWQNDAAALGCSDRVPLGTVHLPAMLMRRHNALCFVSIGSLAEAVAAVVVAVELMYEHEDGISCCEDVDGL